MPFSRNIYLKLIKLICLVGIASHALAASTISDIVVEDFSDMVTQGDTGFDDFSGNMGEANKGGLPYIQCQMQTTLTETLGKQCTWNFGITDDREAYTGLFFNLFGLGDTKARFNADTTEAGAMQVFFNEHSLNLDAIDGIVNEPGGARRTDTLAINLDYNSMDFVASPLYLRVELKDANGGVRFKRFQLTNPTNTLFWNFREQFDGTGSLDINFQKAKIVSLIVERENIGDKIKNPLFGQILVRKIWFIAARPESKPTTHAELLDLLERRAFQYFIDWSSKSTIIRDNTGATTTTNVIGIPQDRSSFGDLLTVGGIGFGLPAYVIGAERGWISRDMAAKLTLSVLQQLADPNAFGPEAIGRIGYKGWLYHFLGVDGKRKLNFDFTATTAVDESKNTVELSAIDTGLALMGVLSAQSYFTGNNSDEQNIRSLAQTIYDRVDWPFMLENQSMQFYLAWKPSEIREGDPFEILDSEGKGKYSGIPSDPATLDYYTDEALILALLAEGSTTHAVPGKSIYCALLRQRNANGTILTYPGSLFTYQFLQTFLDTRKSIFPPCPGEQIATNWFENSHSAIISVIDYAKTSSQFPSYGTDAWGINAAGGPDDLYHAYGAPSVAVNSKPDEDGTLTFYGMVSSLGFASIMSDSDNLYSSIIQGINSAWDRGQWHYRFALPDAYNSNISVSAKNCPMGGKTCPIWLRTQGPWAERALFAIDQGPMLLHLENARSGLIWNLLAANPNIQQAISRFQNPEPTIKRESEAGSGDGSVMPRGNASGQRTVWLQSGYIRNLQINATTDGIYQINYRYSNDGGTDTLQVLLDGKLLGSFNTQDTRPAGGVPGSGWNNFMVSSLGQLVNITPGKHTITLKVISSDYYGVEIDYVELTQPPTLTVAIANHEMGVVRSEPTGIVCGLKCNYFFVKDDSVTLLAQPNEGYLFSGWGGACQGYGNTCTVTMDAAKTVTANFDVYKKKHRSAWRKLLGQWPN